MKKEVCPTFHIENGKVFDSEASEDFADENANLNHLSILAFGGRGEDG